jgi:hypothetical protein
MSEMGSKSGSNEAQTVSALRCYGCILVVQIFWGGHTTSQTTKHQPDFVCTLGVLRVVDEVIDSMII